MDVRYQGARFRMSVSLGSQLRIVGPSTSLSTILRVSAKAWAGVGMGCVLASRSPSSS
jgi:hypothetical protein